MSENFKYSPDDVIKLDEIENESEYSNTELQSMEEMYDGSFNQISDEVLVKGTISSIQDRYVLVDIGFKSEGIVDKDEFDNIDVKIGDEIEVFLDEVENEDGQLLLSYKKALFMHAWDKVIKIHENNEVVKGTCTRRIKGGIVVNILGIDAFLPGSQIDVKPIRDFDAYIGKELDFKVVKVNHLRKNIVVSSRALIEESLSSQREEILKTLEAGQVKEGTVKNITDFGVFIDLGGVDGLLHITDISWGRVNHPSEIVKLDEKIQVKILDFDQERKRISLGLKQLIPHPWENIEERFPIGTKVMGKVVSIADYGAFVEIEKGIEGLIHISEMSWTQNVKHPSQILSVGVDVETIILNIDQETKKISLGLKQLEPDPWSDLEEKFPIGSQHKGIVRNLTAFGAFIELEEGVDGLVHISDLSWTKKIRHPGELIKKGDEIEVVVLSIDRDERRISLGHKQLTDNPYHVFENNNPIGTEKTVNAIKVVDKGVAVDLGDDIEGFIPVNQLGVDKLKKASEKFNEGDEITAIITEIDTENKRVILSVNALRAKAENKNIEDFKNTSDKPTTIGDILKAQQEEQAEKDNN
jgi:small subunit ribosomal protein S1